MMGLSTLIEDLKSRTHEPGLSLQGAGELMSGRVICPDYFERKAVGLETTVLMDQKPALFSHFYISSFPQRTIDEVQLVLDGMMKRSRELKLGEGIADAKYGVFWTPEDFQMECQLPAFLSSTVKVSSKAQSIVPGPCHGFLPVSHEIKASLDFNKLTLEASGSYKKELENLSHALHPEMSLMTWPKGGSYGTAACRKWYGPLGLLQGKRLSDLQSLARIIPGIDLGFIPGTPGMTLDQAKEAAYNHLKLFGQAYRYALQHGVNTPSWRAVTFTRFAGGSSLSRDFTDNLEKMSTTDYVGFLASCGYKVQESFQGERKEKEKYLLAFLKQQSEQDRDELAQQTVERYINKKPEFEILATGKVDASALGRLVLPPKAKLYSFTIAERLAKTRSDGNDLDIGRTKPGDNSIHFQSRTSIDNPILLELQEYVCERMGVKFK
ncbi:MAG TPA: hypothetical protein VJI32_02235 [Candidatus Nanoarchaeia archaeon]|nr:hypothetical protein [Candidatus Nanoarchaeia archaeon]